MATKDSIIALPNPHLRLTSRRVPFLTPEVAQIIDDMKSATLDWEASRQHELGVALAAIQMDKPLRVIVVRHDFNNKDDKRFEVLINPEITKYEGEVEEDYEGCLSVRDIYGRVPRHTKVRVRALNEQGQVVRIKAEGFLARVFQHEIDHTKGIMFIDHIKDKVDAFYKITDSGKLESLAHEKVLASGIFK